jgi:hypothetical protein
MLATGCAVAYLADHCLREMKMSQFIVISFGNNNEELNFLLQVSSVILFFLYGEKNGSGFVLIIP